jgi:hypothetical protein
MSITRAPTCRTTSEEFEFSRTTASAGALGVILETVVSGSSPWLLAEIREHLVAPR